MTTSGTVDFNQNRDQLIRSALRKVGAIAAGEIPTAAVTQDAADQLNAMIKAWMSSGIHIWTQAEATLFVTAGQAQYLLGTGSPDHSAQVFTNTTTTVAKASGTTVFSVASTAGVSNGIAVGVTLDSGSIFWSTASSFTSTTITFASPSTDSVASGANVYIASPNIARPLRIPMARRWQVVNGLEIPMIRMSRFDYMSLPDKTTTGNFTQYFYDPRGGANVTGILYLWPVPNDTSSAVKFTWYRPIEDFDTAGNTPDFPQEWLMTCIWNLALQLAPEYGVAGETYAQIEKHAVLSLELAMGFDKEPESAYFGVDFTQMGYGL